ncbi:MAG: hypothetical protein J7L77_03605 [Clostridiales bacterium]|nr:hypothetical protein [Clostridiales bacterium]
MKLKLPSRNHIEGVITVETAICSAAMILLFSLFFTITGYCRAYLSVKEFIDTKAQDTALLGYVLGFDVPGIISTEEFENVKNGSVNNLLVFCENWGEEVKLNASYTYASLIGNFRVSMESYFTKWDSDTNEKGESVWLLPPVERGKAIESIFGGGLPEFFPVIDAFDEISGHAAAIVSVDTTLDTYASGTELKNVLMQKADELASFKFGEYDETVITGKDIDSRELILVIPENPLNEKQQLAINECYKYVPEISIILSVKRYQNAPVQVTVQQQKPWADVE